MRKNRRDNKAKYLLILLLLIAVGYAAIATTLKINGSAEIKSAKWDVYWENPQVLSGSVTETKPTLSESDTKATFDVTLNEPGDYYEFTIDAVNNGSLNAKIDTNGIVKQVKNSSGQVVNPKILKYEVTNNDAGHTALEEGHILAKKSGSTPTKETYRVRVEYRNDEGIDPADLDDSNDLVFTIEFSVKYVQGPKASQQANAINYITRQNEGQITPGDVIGIGETEDFYVISSNSEKTVLLAKYNLLVGFSNNESTNYEDTYISPSTPGYGLQSVDAIGYVEEYYSSVAFSSTEYWDDGGLKSEYAKDLYGNPASYSGNPYPYVYDNTSTTAPNFSDECDHSTNCWYTPGYSIAYYVEQYITTLKGMGAPSTITGRLLSYEEADDAQSIEDNGTSIIFNDTDYWLGSASSFHALGVGDGSAVRPVIEIPTSELQ